ncbi:hypothetical protein TNCV_4693781 [Trichonephila clavipes]|uniref:Uncharacterized protein n=1 Tax=Trichonephila clavipes TaxID=2585209 RepID=A0A8X7BID0_TRICX|nr:hypothetical protein TNCV_4693781 [Trichonephila clavipes]
MFFTIVVNLFLSNCPLPEHSGRWQRSRSNLPHGGPLEPHHDVQRQPIQQGKFCHLAQGNTGLIVVKGSVQRKFFENLELFTINLEMLPHFPYLNVRTLPDHLHDEVHEDCDISKCTMVKSYLFGRYL